MKVGRREFLTGLYSRETLKKVLASFYGFKEEMERGSRLSCDEIGRMMRKASIKTKTERRDK
ncbi:MAG: hypothetical protein QW561_05140 [Candidatus Aenigmatarchaeota archaeon]